MLDTAEEARKLARTMLSGAGDEWKVYATRDTEQLVRSIQARTLLEFAKYLHTQHRNVSANVDLHYNTALTDAETEARRLATQLERGA